MDVVHNNSVVLDKVLKASGVASRLTTRPRLQNLVLSRDMAGCNLVSMALDRCIDHKGTAAPSKRPRLTVDLALTWLPLAHQCDITDELLQADQRLAVPPGPNPTTKVLFRAHTKAAIGNREGRLILLDGKKGFVQFLVNWMAFLPQRTGICHSGDESVPVALRRVTYDGCVPALAYVKMAQG